MSADNLQQLPPAEAAAFLRRIRRDLPPSSRYVEQCIEGWAKRYGDHYAQQVRKELAA